MFCNISRLSLQRQQKNTRSESSDTFSTVKADFFSVFSHSCVVPNNMLGDNPPKALVLSSRSVWCHNNHVNEIQVMPIYDTRSIRKHTQLRYTSPALNGRLFDSPCRPRIFLPRKIKVEPDLSLAGTSFRWDTSGWQRLDSAYWQCYNLGQNKVEQQTPISPKSRMKPSEGYPGYQRFFSRAAGIFGVVRRPTHLRP